MKSRITYRTNVATFAQIAEHLALCDAAFQPPLSHRLVITDYAKKIADKATRFEAWSNDSLVGLLAAYCDATESDSAYITSVSTLGEWSGNGIARSLLERCLAYAAAGGIKQIRLQVATDSARAYRLYEQHGFIAGESDGTFMTMHLALKQGNDNE